MNKSSENKKRGQRGKVRLIKLHNLKYSAHDQNYKMAIGWVDIC